MAKTFTFKREFFLRQATDFDCLQDLFQNLADEAFGKRLRAQMIDWLTVGMPDWNLVEEQTHTFEKEGQPIATITISPRPDGTLQIILRNNGVILKRDRILEMGHTTKLDCEYTVGCKGVGVKNAMGSWVARHEKETKEPIHARTGYYRWLPLFTKENGQFSLQQHISKDGFVDYFEWTIKCVRKPDIEKLLDHVLWLKPPAEADVLFSSPRGQIYAPGSAYAGRVYINHYYVCGFDIVNGVNLLPRRKGSIELTSDRKNIKPACMPAMKGQMHDLWLEYIRTNGKGTSALYEIVESKKHCWEATLAERFAEEITVEFKRRHGERAYPVSVAGKEEVRRRLRNSFDLITVTYKLRDIIVKKLGDPETILLGLMKAANEVDKQGITFSSKLNDVIGLLRFQGWRAVDVDERFPFVLVDGTSLCLNGYYMVGEHQRVCDDGDGCPRKDWCILAFWVERLAKTADVPLRAAFRLIDDVLMKEKQQADLGVMETLSNERPDGDDEDDDDDDDDDGEDDGEDGVVRAACSRDDAGWEMAISDFGFDCDADRPAQKRKLEVIQAGINAETEAFKKRLGTLIGRHL